MCECDLHPTAEDKGGRPTGPLGIPLRVPVGPTRPARVLGPGDVAVFQVFHLLNRGLLQLDLAQVIVRLPTRADDSTRLWWSAGV